MAARQQRQNFLARRVQRRAEHSLGATVFHVNHAIERQETVVAVGRSRGGGVFARAEFDSRLLAWAILE